MRRGKDIPLLFRRTDGILNSFGLLALFRQRLPPNRSQPKVLLLHSLKRTTRAFRHLARFPTKLPRMRVLSITSTAESSLIVAALASLLSVGRVWGSSTLLPFRNIALPQLHWLTHPMRDISDIWHC